MDTDSIGHKALDKNKQNTTRQNNTTHKAKKMRNTDFTKKPR